MQLVNNQSTAHEQVHQRASKITLLSPRVLIRQSGPHRHGSGRLLPGAALLIELVPSKWSRFVAEVP